MAAAENGMLGLDRSHAMRIMQSARLVVDSCRGSAIIYVAKLSSLDESTELDMMKGPSTVGCLNGMLSYAYDDGSDQVDGWLEYTYLGIQNRQTAIPTWLVMH
jgi:hypothetical protein